MVMGDAGVPQEDKSGRWSLQFRRPDMPRLGIQFLQQRPGSSRADIVLVVLDLDPDRAIQGFPIRRRSGRRRLAFGCDKNINAFFTGRDVSSGVTAPHQWKYIG